MRKLIVIAMGLALGGCAGGVPNTGSTSNLTAGTVVNLSSEQVTAVQNGVGATLKDPYSAKYGEMRATQDKSGLITVCGLVNGKNSLGAYDGAKPFMGTLTGGPSKHGFIVISGNNGSSDVKATISVCSQLGIEVASLSAI